MNPLIRRRLPPSVRSLLTDIGPKEEWTDIEPDTVTRDGIVLPSRGGASEFITPAKTREEEEEGAIAGDGKVRSSAMCMLCESKPSCYTCPRCNLHYCGLACYQSPAHSECSEEFYKESVLRELKDMGKTESEGRRKMQEVLIGLRQKAERTDGGMESLLREAGVLSDQEEGVEASAEDRVRVVELLSRLAQLQETEDEEGNETEMEDILRELEEIGGGAGADEEAEEEPDMADRLSGLDLDKLSEEELWELLSGKEREMFAAALKGGALGGFVQLWRPWWEEHEEAGGRALVEVLQEEEANKPERESPTERDDQTKTPGEVVQKPARKAATKSSKTKGGKGKGKETIPPVSAKIPKLSSLCACPSPLVCYGLANALFGYTFTLCLYNNDTDSLAFEFCDMVLALSEALSSNRVFGSLQEALDRAETLVLDGGYLDREDPLAPSRAVEAVAHVLTGRDRQDPTGYCMAGLSQLRSALSKSRAGLSKEGEEGEKKKMYFLAGKKCEFFQAWLLDNSQRVRTLAIELWNEHSKRESMRSGMEKAKTVVEDKLKKEKSKAKSKLIEELS